MLGRLCSEGTHAPKNIMGKKGHYYQALRAIPVLSEAFTHRQWLTFEKWTKQNNFTWNNISQVVEMVVYNDSVAEQIQLTLDIDQQLKYLHSSLDP